MVRARVWAVGRGRGPVQSTPEAAQEKARAAVADKYASRFRRPRERGGPFGPRLRDGRGILAALVDGRRRQPRPGVLVCP
jgi:hypothetical protein